MTAKLSIEWLDLTKRKKSLKNRLEGYDLQNCSVRLKLTSVARLVLLLSFSVNSVRLYARQKTKDLACLLQKIVATSLVWYNSKQIARWRVRKGNWQRVLCLNVPVKLIGIQIRHKKQRRWENGIEKIGRKLTESKLVCQSLSKWGQSSTRRESTW